MARGQAKSAEDILYGQTGPRSSDLGLFFDQAAANTIGRSFHRPEEALPEIFSAIEVDPQSLEQLAGAQFKDFWPAGRPEQFKSIPVLWVTATYDLPLMRLKNRSMTGGPTSQYSDDTEFFAHKEMAMFAGRRGFATIGVAKEAGDRPELETLTLVSGRAYDMFMMSFAIMPRSLFGEDDLHRYGISRAW